MAEAEVKVKEARRGSAGGISCCRSRVAGMVRTAAVRVRGGGHVRAVDGVNFDLHKGEAIAVVGESGCGKSSLMKTNPWAVPADGGDGGVRRAGDQRDGAQGLDVYRGQVGYVQQDPYGALPPFMSVQRILESPC